MSRWLHILAVLAWGTWWGGLTVYAGIVVPIGTQIIGSTAQGFVTQQVTHWLNAAAVLALMFSGHRVWTLGDRWLRGWWCVVFVATLGLFPLHRQLDSLVSVSDQIVLDHSLFYAWHRGYLWMTSLQWLAGLIVYGKLIRQLQTNSTVLQSPN